MRYAEGARVTVRGDESQPTGTLVYISIGNSDDRLIAWAEAPKTEFL